jgi:hypothetical protein
LTELQQTWEALKRPEYVHVLPNPLPICGMAMAALALVALGFGGWIAHAGGQIRHTEFRAGKPPTARAP